MRVTGGADWKKEDFTALAISTENEVTGNFQCSDEQINQLQSNIYWSQRSNNITIPTDCPTREKAGWTGDVVVYGATALYNQNMTAFYEDWLRSIRLDQLEMDMCWEQYHRSELCTAGGYRFSWLGMSY